MTSQQEPAAFGVHAVRDAYVAHEMQVHGHVIVEGAVVAPPRAEQTLPADVADFVGRRDELQRLLAAAAGSVGAVAIHAVDGMAGVGKPQIGQGCRPISHGLVTSVRPMSSRIPLPCNGCGAGPR